MKVSELLKKKERLNFKAIRHYVSLHENLFGNVNAKKLMKFIAKLYGVKDE